MSYKVSPSLQTNSGDSMSSVSVTRPLNSTPSSSGDRGLATTPGVRERIAQLTRGPSEDARNQSGSSPQSLEMTTTTGFVTSNPLHPSSRSPSSLAQASCLQSLSIRQEIQRFESVHPSIYAVYDLLDCLQDDAVSRQIREHVVNIEGESVLMTFHSFHSYFASQWKLDITQDWFTNCMIDKWCRESCFSDYCFSHV